MFNLHDLEAASELVYRVMPATPQYAWPLLARRYGTEIVVKHENHTPIGAFKVRGGLVYLHRLLQDNPAISGLVSATRGNHGQSLAFAAGQFRVPVAIVVPSANAAEKNAAMRAFGAELIEHGRDFDEAKAYAAELAAERGTYFVPSFHPDLVLGVATYARELFEACGDLDRVYAPLGLGSGLCGLIRTRDLMGLKTEIIGVISAQANAYARSLAAGRPIATNSCATFADGLSVRVPDSAALEMIRAGAARVLEVSEAEIAAAIRVFHEDTHNLAEGAGAAALAALGREAADLAGRKVAVILSGGNIDRSWAACVLAGGTPQPS
jgi:threonine dehydratase